MKVMKSGENEHSDVVEIYKRMFTFDWDLKDICSTRYSPSKYLYHTSTPCRLLLGLRTALTKKFL